MSNIPVTQKLFSLMLAQVLEKLLLDAKQKDLKLKIEQQMNSLGPETTGDDCWEVFRACLWDHNSRIIGLASLQKLIAHFVIRGTTPVQVDFDQVEKEFRFCEETVEQEYILIDDVVLTVSEIALKETREEVLLQVNHSD